MGLVDSSLIAIAERAERGGGARAGLFAWRKLADNPSTSKPLRMRAFVSALRCAGILRDVAAIHELAKSWETLGENDPVPEIAALCKEIVRAGLLVPATAIAWADLVRSPSARSAYLYARHLELAGDRRAPAVFADAIARGEREAGESLVVVRSARVRRAAWLAKRAETLPEAIEEAKRVDPRAVTPSERLTLARVLLRASSRYARASALGVLDDLVCAASPLQPPQIRELASKALRIAAAHADDLGEALTTMETDRLIAIFSREGVAKEAARARESVALLERLARAKDDLAWERALDEAARASPELLLLHRRARDLLAGAIEPAHATPSPEGSSPWSTILDAFVRLRDVADPPKAGGAPRSGIDKNAPLAARALVTLAEREERELDSGARAPAQAWTVATLALATPDDEVRAAAGRLAKAMLEGVPRTPPHGWLGVASALASAKIADGDDLAAHARRLAALAKEPGAEEALALALTRAGWQLAQAGQRSRAIAQLEEAKALWEALRARAPAAKGASPSS